MDEFLTLIRRLVSVCLVSALLECAVGEDETTGPMRILCGLYVSAGCVQTVTDMLKGLFCR